MQAALSIHFAFKHGPDWRVMEPMKSKRGAGHAKRIRGEIHHTPFHTYRTQSGRRMNVIGLCCSRNLCIYTGLTLAQYRGGWCTVPTMKLTISETYRLHTNAASHTCKATNSPWVEPPCKHTEHGNSTVWSIVVWILHTGYPLICFHFLLFLLITCSSLTNNGEWFWPVKQINEKKNKRCVSPAVALQAP